MVLKLGTRLLRYYVCLYITHLSNLTINSNALELEYPPLRVVKVQALGDLPNTTPMCQSPICKPIISHILKT